MSESKAEGRTERLKADCAQCAGLCCAALPFTRSADFPMDKPAGQRCGNLTARHRCSIHTELRERGFTGCSVFDCFGAGQRVTARDGAAHGPQLFAVFRVTRQLHELLWLLTEAGTAAGCTETAALVAELDALIDGDTDTLLATDVEGWRERVGPVLERVSERVRRGLGGRDLRRADLMGARMRGAQLRGAGLRGALLIAADLREADLRQADLLGADLRNTDLRGADLSGALFLTQPQVNAALGDSATAIPDALTRPAHWPEEPTADRSDDADGKSRGDATGRSSNGRTGNGRSGGRGRSVGGRRSGGGRTGGGKGRRGGGATAR